MDDTGAGGTAESILPDALMLFVGGLSLRELSLSFRVASRACSKRCAALSRSNVDFCDFKEGVPDAALGVECEVDEACDERDNFGCGSCVPRMVTFPSCGEPTKSSMRIRGAGCRTSPE